MCRLGALTSFVALGYYIPRASSVSASWLMRNSSEGMSRSGFALVPVMSRRSASVLLRSQRLRALLSQLDRPFRILEVRRAVLAIQMITAAWLDL